MENPRACTHCAVVQELPGRQRVCNGCKNLQQAEVSRRWRANNPEAVAAIKQRFRDKHGSEYQREAERKSYQRHAEKRRAKAARWNRADPFDYHVDHVVPLCKGGEHSYANTQIAHPRCNQSKNGSWPE